jgi:hypothetical protein
MKKLDQSGDTNFRELNRYVRLYDFPEFAKKAELADIIEPESNTSRVFADVRTPNQFPCHNKAATYVSYVYFLEKQSEINPKVRDRIQDRLNKFAGYWNISNATKDATEKNASFKASELGDLSDSTFALVWAGDNGSKERRYPMRNAAETKAAAAWFESYLPEIRKEYGFLDRQTIANKILDKAAEFDVSISKHETTLERCAGRGWCDPKVASAMIRNRVKAGHRVDTPVIEVMSKLAESVEQTPSIFLDPASTANLAETVDQFDRTYHLLNKYSETLPTPEEVLFQATYKQADTIVKEACTTTSGAVYDKNEFSKLSASDVRDLFGDEIASEVITGLNVDPEKMADVASTFPRPDAQLFDRLLEDNGIRPIAKEASDTRMGFSHGHLKQIAELIG